MTVHTSHLRIAGLAMLALSATLLGLPAQAAGKAVHQGEHAQYMRQRALCATQRPAAERDDCLSEASTAYAATQPSLPGDDVDSLLRNQLRRCEPLGGTERQDCQARMRGQGTTSGSVASGGIYRELVTIVPGEPVVLPVAEPVSVKPQR
jgi:hypothetical protein